MNSVRGFSYQEILNLRYHISIYKLTKRIRNYSQNNIQDDIKGFSAGSEIWSLIKSGSDDEQN